MKLKSNFSSSLDFKPLVSWPDTVPAIAVGSELLSGFDLPDDHPVFAHEWRDRSTACQILKSIYPQLTLAELARLNSSSHFQNFFQLDELLKIYGYQSSAESAAVLNVLACLSREFQNFISSKKMGIQELIPLTDIGPSDIHFVATEVLTHDESRQESAKRIEFLSDLLRMGHSSADLRGLSLKDLTEKRYPVTSGRDQNLREYSLPWLSQIRSQFKRRGDKAGFEVQFFAGTPAELQKLATNLAKVAEIWNGRP